MAGSGAHLDRGSSDPTKDPRGPCYSRDGFLTQCCPVKRWLLGRYNSRYTKLGLVVRAPNCDTRWRIEESAGCGFMLWSRQCCSRWPKQLGTLSIQAIVFSQNKSRCDGKHVSCFITSGCHGSAELVFFSKFVRVSECAEIFLGVNTDLGNGGHVWVISSAKTSKRVSQ